MSPRAALVIEPDETFASALRHALAPYGFEVEVVADGKQAIEIAQGAPPALILLSVEPKNVGYAICNKVKKNAALRDVPLILMSSEATPETFEQHRKLKTRADEYYLKSTPDEMDGLLQKIDGLCTLGEPGAGEASEDTIDIPVEAMDEITLDEDDVDLVEEDEEEAAPPPPRDVRTAGGFGDDEEKTRVTIESDIDDAFASLELGEDGRAAESAPLPETVVAAPPEEPAATAPLEVPPSMEEPSVGYQAQESNYRTRESALAPEREFAPQHTAADAVEELGDEALDLGLEAVAASAPPAASAAEDEELVDDLRARVRKLEAERERLTSELATARSQPAAGGASFSREREFLNLREVINRKEKEVLDLKDEIDAKDRQILDHKDKIRELERKSRDLDERILHIERQLVAANEKNAAFAGDKEKGVEREKQLKARLEDAQREIQKAHEEIDNLKKRHATALEQAKSEIDRTRAEAAQRVADLEAEARATVERMTRERQEAEADLRNAHQRTTEGLRAEAEARFAERERAHQAEMEGLSRSHTETIQGLRARAQADLQQFRQEREAVEAVLREEHAADLAALKEAHETAEAELAVRHQDETAALRAQGEEQLARAERRRVEELGQAEQRRQQELAGQAEEHRRETQAAAAAHQAELAAQGEQHALAVAGLERAHVEEKVALEEERRAEREEAERRLQALEQQRRAEQEEAGRRLQGLEEQRRAEQEAAGRRLQGLEEQRRAEQEAARKSIAGLEEELASSQSRSAELGRLLDAARNDIAQRDAAIGGLSQQIEELEAQSAAFQEQALRALTKIRNDQALGAKAKKALAIALTLLEEQEKNALPEASRDGEATA